MSTFQDIRPFETLTFRRTPKNIIKLVLIRVIPFLDRISAIQDYLSIRSDMDLVPSNLEIRSNDRIARSKMYSMVLD